MISRIIQTIDEDTFIKVAHIWTVTGVGRPERGDTLELVRRTLRFGGRFLTMLEDNEPIGTAWITNDGRRLYLHHMAVLPEKQGQGYGRLLLEESIGIADTMGMQMKLEVHEENAVARHLYRRAGFTEDLAAYRVMIRR